MINNEMDMLDMLDRTRTKKHVYNYEMLTIFTGFSNIYKLCSVLLDHAGEVPVVDPVIVVAQGPLIVLEHGGHVKRVVHGVGG